MSIKLPFEPPNLHMQNLTQLKIFAISWATQTREVAVQLTDPQETSREQKPLQPIFSTSDILALVQERRFESMREF